MPLYRYDDDEVLVEIFQKTIIGGDLLTCKRARGAQNAVINELTPTLQLKGLVPVTEDWHARQCLMQVYIQVLGVFTYELQTSMIMAIS